MPGVGRASRARSRRHEIAASSATPSACRTPPKELDWNMLEDEGLHEVSRSAVSARLAASSSRKSPPDSGRNSARNDSFWRRALGTPTGKARRPSGRRPLPAPLAPRCFLPSAHFHRSASIPLTGAARCSRLSWQSWLFELSSQRPWGCPCSTRGLRSHPWNLTRVMPAEGTGTLGASGSLPFVPPASPGGRSE